MTYQIQDDFRYKGAEYTLTACSAGEPFHPGLLGIRPNMASTACWRGYVSTYGVQDHHLVLAELRLELVEDEIDYVRVPGPVIHGVTPIEKAPGLDGFNNNYLDLNLPIDYDGGLIIGGECLERYHGDLDLITLWKYRKVLELRFVGGRLEETIDHSAAMLPIQRLADERDALVKDLFDAMESAASDEERAGVRGEYRDALGRSAGGADLDDVAREMLRGVIDLAYLSD